MNDSLEVIVEMIAIVTFCCGVVNYTVIKPLKTSIDTLASEIRDLKTMLYDVDDDVAEMKTRVTVNEKNIKTLDARVTNLESYHKQPIGGGK